MIEITKLLRRLTCQETSRYQSKRARDWIESKKPAFAGIVEAYIKTKSRTDLPNAQFTRELNPRVLADFVEIGGFLSYQGDLREIDYCGPDLESVVKEIVVPGTSDKTVSEKIWNEFYGGGPAVRRITTSVHQKVPLSALLELSNVIEWHTHPDSRGIPSSKDISTNKTLKAHLPYSKVYSIIFEPATDNCVWYQTT